MELVEPTKLWLEIACDPDGFIGESAIVLAVAVDEHYGVDDCDEDVASFFDF